ncbi:hypothetical protein PpBr36_03806 [Pyricularia pennisetigena]|uniref:hypothetical protein n=1 Tax=Pyricularia pennisetigena TaxID=1578925 RepID=UPI0011526C8D|nr:hypothetical protein PpBr36_03806 [Pyricularia pennisetigena]TLS30250.1 hypothetical protein PpBr36_03806 [Pyricularia pennisetigena]
MNNNFKVIANNAFAADNLITFLKNLKGPKKVKYVKFFWKEKMFDREIIQINYTILLRFWKRLEDFDFFKRNFRIRAYRDQYANFKDNCFLKVQKQCVINGAANWERHVITFYSKYNILQ